MKIIKKPRKNPGFHWVRSFDARRNIAENFVCASEKMYAVRGSTYAALWNGILIGLEPFGRPWEPLWGLLARCFGACWALLDALGRSWATLGALLEASFGAPSGHQLPPVAASSIFGGPKGSPRGPKGSPRGPQGVSVECRRG